MIDWTTLKVYLAEAEGYARSRMEDVADIPRMDEQVTVALKGLGEEGYHLDLTDEATVYALVVGFCVAYRYGCSVQHTNPENPAVPYYLRLHGNLSGNIGLVARQIVRNLNLDLDLTGAAE